MKLFGKLPLLIKILVIACLVGLVWFGYKTIRGSTSAKTQYQTETVTKGNLIVSVSASGQVSTANSATVTTEASGVVTKLYAKNGDAVKVGDKIAQIELDLDGRQRSTQAYASYQSAKNNLDTAKANLFSAQSTMLADWQQYMDKAQNSTYENTDDSPNTSNRQLTDFVITQDDWLATEAKYKVQQNAITQAQTALNTAWYSYQKASPVIYAPISGTVTGLSLQEGAVITAQTTTTGSASSQKIASILTTATPIVTINITQIDVPKIAIGNKATVTLDAFPDKTFAGTVVSIDMVGTTTSGVTTYPTVIKLDTDLVGILPNMSLQANIITAIRDDVLVVSSSAVQTQDGGSTVRVMKNNTPEIMAVETGLSSDTQTEIISGLFEGDMVVTGTMSNGSSATTTTSSPFGMFGSRGSGGQIRVAR